MKTIGFFNNKGGVGKTSLVCHLSWMFAEMGHCVVAADLDPQANMSAMFMGEDKLKDVWDNDDTIHTSLSPLIKGTGDLAPLAAQTQHENIFLIVGDMRLSGDEDLLSEQWTQCLEETPAAERAFRVETAFFRIIQKVAEKHNAAYALVDVGPNLGAINRAALLACDYIITPLSPDLFTWQGLHNMKPALKNWKNGWQKRKENFNEFHAKDAGFCLPNGDMTLLGYVPMRFPIHASRPVKSYQKWMDLMPEAFSALQGVKTKPNNMEEDDNYLGMLKDYRSLMPMAQEKRKPMFHLSAADGAFGAHAVHVNKCRQDFKELASKIIAKIDARH